VAVEVEPVGVDGAAELEPVAGERGAVVVLPEAVLDPELPPVLLLGAGAGAGGAGACTLAIIIVLVDVDGVLLVSAGAGLALCSPEEPALTPAAMRIGADEPAPPPPDEPPPQPTLAARNTQPATNLIEDRVEFTMADAHEWRGRFL